MGSFQQIETLWNGFKKGISFYETLWIRGENQLETLTGFHLSEPT
jgi:hypothetical protein